jgi:PAS domain-containing protein
MKGRRRQYEARARLNDLADGERRLQAALEAGRLGSWELQLKANRLSTSVLCRTILGQPEDMEPTYEQLLATVHADDRRRTEHAISQTIETGRDCEIDFRCV